MTVTRRQLLIGIAATAALGAVTYEPISQLHITHEREPHIPLVWNCVGWTPGDKPGHVYVVVARYSREDEARFGADVIRSRVESFVKRRLSRMEPADLHLDGYPDWDKGGFA